MLDKNGVERVIELKKQGLSWERISNIERVSSRTLIVDVKKAGRYEEVRNIDTIRAEYTKKDKLKNDDEIEEMNDLFEKYCGYEQLVVINKANSKFNVGLKTVIENYKKWRRAWVSSCEV